MNITIDNAIFHMFIKERDNVLMMTLINDRMRIFPRFHIFRIVHQEQIHEFGVPKFSMAAVAIKPREPSKKTDRVANKEKRVIQDQLATSGDRDDRPPFVFRQALGERCFSAPRQTDQFNNHK